VSVHVPSAIDGKLHVVTLGEATYVQETVVEPLVAVIVTVSLLFTPLAPTEGVESFVISSLVELPVSDELSRSGIFGAEIAETVMLSVDEVARLRMSTTEYET
jgi:hypothetical protein